MNECLEWIVQCDVKPENILSLDEEFEPKIADFGLVKLLGRGAAAQMLSSAVVYRSARRCVRASADHCAENGFAGTLNIA